MATTHKITEMLANRGGGIIACACGWTYGSAHPDWRADCRKVMRDHKAGKVTPSDSWSTPKEATMKPVEPMKIKGYNDEPVKPETAAERLVEMTEWQERELMTAAEQAAKAIRAQITDLEWMAGEMDKVAADVNAPVNVGTNMGFLVTRLDSPFQRYNKAVAQLELMRILTR